MWLLYWFSTSMLHTALMKNCILKTAGIFYLVCVYTIYEQKLYWTFSETDKPRKKCCILFQATETAFSRKQERLAIGEQLPMFYIFF